MPKHLFSKSGFRDFKDLMRHVRRPRRINIVVNPKKHKKDVQHLKTQKTNGGPQPSLLSGKNDQKLQPTLENLLKDKKLSAAFRDFLRSEFSEENMEFWLACEDFKSTASPDNLHGKAEKIHREFLQPTACREINVDHCIREKISACLEDLNLSCFDEAQEHVFLLMERDSYPRFLQSDAFLRLQCRSGTLWYI